MRRLPLALALALLCSALPASSQEIPWETLVGRGYWQQLRFRDHNGQQVTVSYPAALLDEYVKAGKNVPLYARTFVEEKDRLPAELPMAAIEVYRARLTPFVWNGRDETVTTPGGAYTAVCEHIGRTFAVGNVKEKVYRPTEDPYQLSETMFAGLDRLPSAPADLAGCYGPADSKRNRDVLSRRFLPFEYFFADGVLFTESMLCPVEGSADLSAIIAAMDSEPTRVDAMIKDVRDKILASAERRYNESMRFATGSDGATLQSFAPWETTFLLKLIFSQGEDEKEFFKDVRLAIKDNKRAEFVAKWRAYMMSELILYRDELTKRAGKAVSVSDHDIESFDEARYRRFVGTGDASDDEQERANVLRANRGWIDDPEPAREARRRTAERIAREIEETKKRCEDGEECTDR
jgi:hypothetical protein